LLRSRWQTHVLIAIAYTLLALALTWPLVAYLPNHVPGNGIDDPPLTWNLWWVRYALLDLGTNPFDCNYLFYPVGINLAFYTLTLLNGMLSFPLQALLGLVPASNLLLLSSFVLSGYGAFLLSFYLLHGESPPRLSSGLRLLLPPFVAGLLYAFAASKLSYAALGQWNIASSQWIPFYVLFLFRMSDHPGRRRYTFLAVLFLLFQAYAELTYATFLVLFTALWLVWRFVCRLRREWQARRAERPDARFSWPSDSPWQYVASLALVGLLVVVGLAPMLAMMLPDMLVEGDIFVEGGGFADVFSADLLGFLIPTMYHPIFGSLVEHFDFDHSVGQHIYVGYSVLALVTVGIVSWWRLQTGERLRALSASQTRARRDTAEWLGFWLLSTLAFWLLTLGPALRINGQATGLPMPFALVAKLPLFEGNRYPSRYSVMLFLSLAMLVAFGLAALFRKERNRGSSLPFLAGLVLPALLVFEHLSIPLPLSDMTVPSVYQAVADELPGDFALLDLPVAWRNGFRVTGTQHPLIMFQQYYQAVHGKRLLAGNTSRNPPLKFQYFTEAPVINTLIALETDHQIEPSVIERDRALAADVLRFFNIRAVLVHPAQVGQNVAPYVEAVMPVESWYKDEQILAYQVKLPPWPETWTIVPGEDLGRLSYVEGWGRPAGGVVWAQRQAVRLLVPLNGEGQRMAFRAFAPEEGQRLVVEVNGQVLGQMGMAAGWLDYELALSGDSLQPGLNEIWMRFEQLTPAAEVSLISRTIGQTVVTSPVNLVVDSAGNEVGDFGHIYVNGHDLSPNERGYNVVVVHPLTGVVEAVAAFDTHLSGAASQAMAEFLREVPPGHVVAVAAADEVSQNLGEEAVEALRGIGATGDLRAKFRWGHAIIGIQGAPPGSAAEASDWMYPVVVTAGDGATEPYLAAALATITFTAESLH
jgi:hypothetical protein